MSRIQLRIYTAPGQIDVFCRLKTTDGRFERLTATVDTGASVSLFPVELLEALSHRVTTQDKITIDQAGIAKQSFEAVEAIVTIFLEDESGNLTNPFEIPAWFAETDQPLIGFAGILDRAILHIDMPQQSGWLELRE